MSSSLLTPDLRRILDDLARRLGILERRTTRTAPQSGAVPTHSHDGTGTDSTITHPSADTDAIASGTRSVAVGDNAQAYETSAVAVGDRAYAGAGDATAVGRQASVSADLGTAFGAGAQADGLGSTAVGSAANAPGEQSTAIGMSAQAGWDYSTAVGTNASTHAENQVMLGTSDDHVVIPGRPVITSQVDGSRWYLNVAADGTLSTEAV